VQCDREGKRELRGGGEGRKGGGAVAHVHQKRVRSKPSMITNRILVPIHAALLSSTLAYHLLRSLLNDAAL
jgi:hypothetical protein